VAQEIFRDGAKPLQQQVDAATLSVRAAMNEMEGVLIDIRLDPGR